MANKCIKMCSILLHYQLHENVNMKRTDKDDKDVEQLELSYTAVDIYIDINHFEKLAIPTNVEFTHYQASIPRCVPTMF